ncbi:ABC transporter ATP-binding protein [Paenibacillus thermoaerophilus]|uniref:ABC transporter ATP-binding protein n=1 Tax=Paenibacillus thermoaerophilus TaxID=1215385 RepID=A0ABW2V2V8_9BACL|nr:ABC transporter ATP-binding protein [Paenibacillus thermoaerophilus]TMV18424.1 ABC transporter ATP-binding protein [Paenibacillus thermoaerophilus]
MIELTDICKEYGSGAERQQILKGITLSVGAGEFVAVVGPSGSGKSTLMNIIGLLDVPTSGTYVLDGVSTANLNDNQLAELRNRKIGFIFQQFNLLPGLTAIENVELPLLYAGMSRKERRERAAAVLEAVGMGHRMFHRPNQLSGGQQQRVAISRALAGSPALLLADEPTGALDSRTGAEVLELMIQLNEQGHTIVLITHDPEIAERSRRIVHIRDGEIVEDRASRGAAPPPKKEVPV